MLEVLTTGGTLEVWIAVFALAPKDPRAKRPADFPSGTSELGRQEGSRAGRVKAGCAISFPLLAELHHPTQLSRLLREISRQHGLDSVRRRAGS